MTGSPDRPAPQFCQPLSQYLTKGREAYNNGDGHCGQAG